MTELYEFNPEKVAEFNRYMIKYQRYKGFPIEPLKQLLMERMNQVNNMTGQQTLEQIATKEMEE